MPQRYQINIAGVDAHEASKALFDTNQFGFAGHNTQAIERLYRGALAHLRLTPEQARASDGNPNTPDPNADRVYAYYMELYNNATDPGRKRIIADAISQFRYERRISLEQEAGRTQYYIPPEYGRYTTTITSEYMGETHEVPSGGWVGEAFNHASGAARRVQQATAAAREQTRLGALPPLDRAIEESVTRSDLNWGGINDSVPAMRGRVKAILITAGVDPETGELKPGRTDADARLALVNANIRLSRHWNSALRIDRRDAEYALRVYNHMHPPAGQATDIAPEEAAAAAGREGAAAGQGAAGQGALVLGYPAIDPQVQLDLETLGKSTGRNNTNKFGAGATDMDGARGPATQSAIASFKAAHPDLEGKTEAEVFAAIRAAAEAQRAAAVEARSIVTALGNATTGMLKDGLDATEKGTLHTRLAALAGHLNTNAQGDLQTVIRSIVTAVTPAVAAGDTQLQADLTALRAKAGMESQRQ